jgi:hypothetical protein
MNALKRGYENKFQWGVEASGPNKSFRVLQKRGKILHEYDFRPIKETYPKFPKGVKEPLFKSQITMKEQKRKDLKDNLEIGKKKWDEK